MNGETLTNAATRAPIADPIWFLGLTTWVRAAKENSDSNASVIEQKIPLGFASPWHVHNDEHEMFFVLDGEIEVIVGEEKVILGKGAFGFGPCGVPHGFRVIGDKTAHILLMTSGPHFADFVRELSQPYSDVPPPPPGPEAMPMLLKVAEKHNLTILGPMPE